MPPTNIFQESTINPAKTVLIIGIANSIHTARWLAQFDGTNLKFILFPSTPSRTIHPLIAEMVSGTRGPRVSVPYRLSLLAMPLALLDLITRNRIRSYLLNRILKENQQIKVIHAAELQHAGYLSLGITRKNLSNRRLIVTNWGSDIFWFQRFRLHKNRISRLLKMADEYSCECSRDVILATDFGFMGKVHEVLPNAGGIPDTILDSDLSPNLPSSRKIILVKGYTRFVGLADIALESLAQVGNEISNFEIVVYSTDPKTRRIIKRLQKTTDLNIRAIAKHGMSHGQMLQLFSSARIYIGISRSDGISTSLLEAMSTGCFPIQTSTSCASEWVTHGLSGFLVDHEDVKQIASAIREAAVNDSLVDNAAGLNRVTAQARLRTSLIREKNQSFYELS
jgi:glycosyltransferase involved in cell wall biosynthesis